MALQPTDGLFKIAIAMFKNNWKRRSGKAAAFRLSLKRESAQIERQTETLASKVAETSNRRVMVAYESKPDQPRLSGPVCPDLYAQHRGQFTVAEIAAGNAGNLSIDEQQDIDGVVDSYNRFTGQQPSDITHAEKPWLSAREGLPTGVRGNHEITLEALTEYYGSL